MAPETMLRVHMVAREPPVARARPRSTRAATLRRMSRPNIILIITDQQRYDTVAALGFPHVDTPHLDALVRDGVSFTQCHVTAPSCGPSRASLFTGYYPHNVGALRNNDPWPRTWVEDLRAAGYYCVNVGKMHAAPYSAMHGFHERFVVESADNSRICLSST